MVKTFPVKKKETDSYIDNQDSKINYTNRYF